MNEPDFDSGDPLELRPRLELNPPSIEHNMACREEIRRRAHLDLAPTWHRSIEHITTDR